MRPRIHAARAGALWQCCNQLEGTMTDWPLHDGPCADDPHVNHSPAHRVHPYGPSTSMSSRFLMPPPPPCPFLAPLPKGDNPRVLRNKAEKHRRDKLNQSITELAAMVPPVVAANKKIDKTGVLRLTAHYLRSHQHVFGNSMNNAVDMKPAAAKAVLKIFNGFLLTTTYKGLIVVVSQNVQQYLGYNEIDLLGHSIFGIVHIDDHKLLRDQLTPRSTLIGANGELVIPDSPNGEAEVAALLAQEKRRFFIRMKRLGQRSEPSKYLTCHVEGSFRKSDRACAAYSRSCTVLRRARARYENPRSSGNDVVFIGVVRIASETFMSETELESFRMEHRTRHSVDGRIIDCDDRIALTTGFMTNEVRGVNAMNFMHRDDVRWVIVALREMYDKNRLSGESCYRLITKNGQLVYMRTKGHLEINQDSSCVTSFICVNTVVDEEEGKILITRMKKKFMLLLSCAKHMAIDLFDSRPSNNTTLPIEDPRYLEKVILYLVTNLPSLLTDDENDKSGVRKRRLTIVAPDKEKIISAIEKIYHVLNGFIKPKPVGRVTEIEDLSLQPSTSQQLPKIEPLGDDEYQESFVDVQPTQTPTLPHNEKTKFDADEIDIPLNETNGKSGPLSPTPFVYNGNPPQIQPHTQLMSNESQEILSSTQFVTNEHLESLPHTEIMTSRSPIVLPSTQFDANGSQATLPHTNILIMANVNPEILLPSNFVAEENAACLSNELVIDSNSEIMPLNQYESYEHQENLTISKNNIQPAKKFMLKQKSSGLSSAQFVATNNISSNAATLRFKYNESSTMVSNQYETSEPDSLNVNVIPEESFFQDYSGGEVEEFSGDSFFQDVFAGNTFDMPNIVDDELNNMCQSLDVVPEFDNEYFGKKRPMDCPDNVTAKKKMTEPQIVNDDLLDFENLFKDIEGIEEDFTCFENSYSLPNEVHNQSFPDFLVSSEIEDFFEGIEEETDKDKR